MISLDEIVLYIYCIYVCRRSKEKIKENWIAAIHSVYCTLLVSIAGLHIRRCTDRRHCAYFSNAAAWDIFAEISWCSLNIEAGSFSRWNRRW